MIEGENQEGFKPEVIAQLKGELTSTLQEVPELQQALAKGFFRARYGLHLSSVDFPRQGWFYQVHFWGDRLTVDVTKEGVKPHHISFNPKGIKRTSVYDLLTDHRVHNGIRWVDDNWVYTRVGGVEQRNNMEAIGNVRQLIAKLQLGS